MWKCLRASLIKGAFANGKADMKKYRYLIKRFCGALIGFCVFFYLFDISAAFCLLFLDLFLAVVVLLYKRSRPGLFASVLSLVGGGTLGYFVVRLLQGYILRMPTALEGGLEGIAVVLCGFCAYYMCSQKKETKTTKAELFKEQEYDIGRLRKYILQFPLLGIHARWGNGKSFVWAYLKEDPEICKEFDIVQIDLLAVDLDSVEIVLIDELERVLECQKIQPQSSHRLKLLLGQNQWLQWAGSLLYDDGSGLSAAFDALQRDLEKTEKRVLICFEDIDRISDPEKIKRIFAISERLSSERVHIIFQYNMNLLHSMDNGALNHDYLEKYIPFTVSLTEIPYQSLIQTLWDRLKMEQLPLDSQKVYYIGFLYPSYHTVEFIWGCENIGKIPAAQIPADSLVSIRKARDYLMELKVLLLSNTLFSKEKNAEIVAHTLFIKHFFPEDYDRMVVGESPLETFCFEGEEKRYTLPELLKKYQKVPGETKEEEAERLRSLEMLLSIPKNGHRLALLMLLGYEFAFASARTSEPFSPEQRREEKNRKIDHLVWNLLANGSSELTDAENDIDQLEKIVLDKEEEHWIENWEIFQEKKFKEDFPKRNKNIGLIGHGPFMDTFRAMQITGSVGWIQSRFLPVFFLIYRQWCKAITVELLECLVCCDLMQERALLAIVRFFNSLDIVDSPVRASVYRIFFARYMGAICNLGYCKRQESWMFELPLPKYSNPSEAWIKELTEAAQESLDCLRQELTELRENEELPYTLPYVREDYDSLIAFVEKNQELLKAKTPRPGPNFGVKTKYNSRWVHQSEVDRLCGLKENAPDAFPQELQESYQAGKICMQELGAVLADAPKSD